MFFTSFDSKATKKIAMKLNITKITLFIRRQPLGTAIIIQLKKDKIIRKT